MMGYISNIQRFSTQDGPGLRTTVFLKGCPLRCKWCHNPETWQKTPECMQRRDRCTGCGACVSACPQAARQLSHDTGITLDRTKCTGCGKCAAVCPTNATELCGYETDTEAVFREVERDRLFYKSSGGGLTVSGGECAMQPDFTDDDQDGYMNKGLRFAEIYTYSDKFMPRLKMVDGRGNDAVNGKNETKSASLQSLLEGDLDEVSKKIVAIVDEILKQVEFQEKYFKSEIRM